jgi:Tat protein secretion system quality control protein TatD with DNase activity
VTADLPEAPQTPERLITISQVTESAYVSPKKVRQATRGVNKPMLVVETDSEVLEAESLGRRRKRNTKLPGWLEGFELE